MDNIPHLAWPIRYVNGKYVTVQQDTDSEVAQAVGVIVSFRRGFRIEKLDFGIFDPTFSTQPIDTTDLQQACSFFEPRANVDLEQWEDSLDPGHVLVRLRVTQPTSDELPEE